MDNIDNETLVKSVRFNTNLLLSYLKVDFELTSKRLMGYSPNEVLGFLPIGAEEISFPLRNIASVGLISNFHLARLILGLLLFIVAYKVFTFSFIISIIVALIGVANILNCYTLIFNITNSAGESPSVEVSILEKNKLQSFVDTINHTIANL